MCDSADPGIPHALGMAMFGLRQKLVFSFGGLLVILLIVGGLGIGVSARHRNALNQFLYENWRSIEYGQNMVDALDRLGDIARQVSVHDPRSMAEARAAAAGPIAVFARNLNDENHNITLPGEQKLADELTRLWGGSNAQDARASESYSAAFATLVDSAASPAQRATSRDVVLRLAPRVKAGAQSIIKLNFENMTPLEGQVKRMADNAMRLTVGLTLAGIALATLLVIVMGRSILQPVRTLTRSAQLIEQGNLDLVVQVKSRDELRQLAEAFNSMTAKLREFRRTNRARLIRTQQTTQLAINSLPDAVAILSPDGMVEMANAAAQRLFALEPDAHINAQRAEWLVELYRRTTQTLQPVEPRGYESAIQVLDEGGGERFFLPHAVPILDDDRQLQGVTVVLADVTHLRRLDEMKSGMLSVVSHELKTPLTSIRMGVHLLLEERLGTITPQQNDILVAVRDDSERLYQIVENLLDMGRIESGRALMELKPESVESIVLAGTESMRAAFADRGVELTADIPDDLPPVIADAGRVRLVFSNLLSNALKYTRPGGNVTVTARADDQTVRFAVRDSGSGIPQQYQSRIFERFFRVPGQAGVTGAGLGLAIAREIIEAHNGRISVESRENVGSTFSFTLPRADPAPALVEHIPTARTERAEVTS